MPDNERLYRNYPAAHLIHKSIRTPKSWPWPDVGAFEPDERDGCLSVNHGKHIKADAEEFIRNILSKTRNSKGKFLNPDDFGIVVIGESSASSFGYKIKDDPVEETENNPANEAHALIIPPEDLSKTSIMSDLRSLALGFSPPPAFKGAQWRKWEPVVPAKRP